MSYATKEEIEVLVTIAELRVELGIEGVSS